jgi:hypothetical protein
VKEKQRMVKDEVHAEFLSKFYDIHKASFGSKTRAFETEDELSSNCR